ncbi:MAG: hypothetical protein CMC93_00455 [Flavobacteriaceae bacterium]|nr:hypothetical protein [Flavobacteriaceae bacterium]|tara:strand:+ start:7057 stop:7380 length:324 start_codon:yes stop_codon:yes gene_type:complete
MTDITAPVLEKYEYKLDPEFKGLFNGKFELSYPVTLQKITSSKIIHTRKSRQYMDENRLTQEKVIEAINTGSTVNQNDTIFCKGREVNIRLVKKDDKYLVIDMYLRT